MLDLNRRIELLSQPGRDVVRSIVDDAGLGALRPGDILAMPGLTDYDRLLLLLWPEIVGPRTVQRIVDLCAGMEPCCEGCHGHEAPERRQTFKGALFSMRCHLKRFPDTQAQRLSAIIDICRDVLVREDLRSDAAPSVV